MEPKAWHALSPAEAAAYWESDLETGLTEAAARERLAVAGPNRIEQTPAPAFWQVVLRQLQDVVVLILCGAALISLVLGERVDAAVIGAIIVINAVLGALHEYKAERAVEALTRLTAPQATVMRDGMLRRLDAAALVPGDLIHIAAGDRVPADARLVEAAALELDEAPLTGEAEAVFKHPQVLPPETPLAERHNMVFQGTAVVAGRGTALVVATGMATEVGRVATLMQQAPAQPTPLQLRLQELGRWLVGICAAICAAVVVAGLAGGQPLYVMFLAGVSLAVAAIPEGLPAVVTILLGLGVQRMAAFHAVVRRLPAAETLGCTTVIAVDKTGTLTENRMRLAQVWLPGDAAAAPLPEREADPRLHALLRSASLCSNIDAAGGQAPVNPTERALHDAVEGLGLPWRQWRRGTKRLHEWPFDSVRKRMTVVLQGPGQWEVHSKGAPEVILPNARMVWDGARLRPLTQAEREAWLNAAGVMADQALRVLAVAFRRQPGRWAVDSADAPVDAGDVERDLVLLGLVGLFDPPRTMVAETIARCRQAGIRLLMITGDHARTALAVGRQVGLLSNAGASPPEALQASLLDGDEIDRLDDHALRRRLQTVQICARVAPEHKLRIVNAMRAQGEIVAMTGDGVNDAPAVKAADIGIAMGRTGTDVTREAADLVLLDDNLETLARAVEYGRAIYANVRKFVRYLLASNAGEVFVMVCATLAGMPLPLLPIQILFVNLVTDGLPAIALSMEPPEGDEMKRPPRSPGESLFAHGLATRIVVWGAGIGVIALALFVWTLQRSGDLALARTMALGSLVLSQMFHVWACRRERRGRPLALRGNPLLLLAIVSSLSALALVIYWPPLAAAFGTAALPWQGWLALVAGSGLLSACLQRLDPPGR